MDRRKSVVNVHEAKTHLSRLLERAHRGETIVLAKAGKPYARLVPLEAREPRKPGALKGRITIGPEFNAPLPEEIIAAFEGRPPRG
jgi:prevent-host-death family protein